MLPIASVLPATPRLKIIDVGAAEAVDPPAYARLMNALPCLVIGFEPRAGECEKLNGLNKPGHLYLPHAIGDGEPHTFYECSAPHCSSLFEPDRALADKFHNLGDLLRVVDSHTIETRRLDDLPETAGADFLKIDVQGGELLVLRGAVDRLKDVLVVHTEVEFLPLYKNQPLFADVDSFLRARGFAFHTLIPFGRTFRPMLVKNNDDARFRQIIWADGIYVRDFMRFAELTADSLLKLACILHENYQSFDAAALALDAYDKQMGGRLQLNYLEHLSEG